MALAATGSRYLLGAIFVFAGLAKLSSRREFTEAIERYGILPHRLIRPVANLLPFFELLSGVLLIVGLGIVFTSAALAATVIAFTIAIGINLARGESFDCGCRALGAPRKIGWAVVGRNVLLAAIAVLTAIEAPAVLALDARFGGRSANAVSSSDAFAVLFSACIAVLAFTLLEEALSLNRAVAARQAR